MNVNTAQHQRSMLVAQVLKVLCKLASVLVLARLVSPADHGLFAMASSLVLLLALFRDAGLGAAAVQAATLTSSQLNTLLWCHLGLGTLLTLVTVALAPLTARFYEAVEVRPLLLTMSVSFLLIGAGGFARSQLERAARFSDTSRIESIAAIIGTLSMIAAAFGGAGAYSFVVFLLVSETVATVLAWRAWSWRPSERPRWSSVGSLLRVGTDVTAYQVIAYFVQQLDGIVVGRLFGAQSLGFYNRSNQLLSLPNLHVATPLNQVALVTLSRLGRDSRDFVTHARQTATLVAHLVLPLYTIAIVLPDETIRLILGQQWLDAAPLLRLLSIAAAAGTLTALGYAINVAAGQTRRLVISAAVSLPLTAGAIAWGAGYGPRGIAAGIAIVNMGLLLPRLWWALRELPHGFAHYIQGLIGPTAAAGAAALGLLAGRHFAADQTWPWRLASGIAGGALCEVTLIFCWPRLRSEWREVMRSLPLPWRLPNAA